MRKVKFKAKDVVTGEWRYGHYIEVASEMACVNRQPSKHLIVFQQFVDWGFDPNVQAEVDPATVEQISGDLVDENKRLRDVLDKLARLGNEPCYGSSVGNQIAIEALKEK